MKNLKVGLQMHGVRDALSEDFEGTLKAVRAMGYDYIEFAGGLPASAEEIKEILDKYDLKAISIHWDVRMFDVEPTAIADLKTLGVKYSVMPGCEPEEFLNNWDKTIEKFKKTGKLLADNGLQLVYHNHESEFIKVDGEYIFDKLFSTIPQEYLAPQIDTCWVHFAGENPVDYLLKYAGKIDVVHLKDYTCEKSEPEKTTREARNLQFTPVGYGILDWKSILEAVVKAGAGYIIVEQDESPSGDPMGDAKKSREYLKNTFGI